MNLLFSIILSITYFALISYQCEFPEFRDLVSISDYPYMVGIINKSSNKFICAGIIIGELEGYGIVLTAANCISKSIQKQHSNGSIIVRSNLKGTTNYKIIKTHLHPKYASRAGLNNEFNIGMIAIKGPWKGITDTSVIKFELPILSSPPHKSSIVTTLGWNQSHDPMLKDLRIDNNLKILPAGNCSKNTGIKVSSQMFCVANTLNRKLGSAYANVGGPLLYFNDNKAGLLGVISTVANSSHPAVVVNASRHENFVNDVSWVLKIDTTSIDKRRSDGGDHDRDFCHIKLSYKNVAPNDVTFYFYARGDKNGTKIKVDAYKTLPPKFGLNKKIIFISHGWTGDYKTECAQLVKDAVLNASEANVFLIDWKNPAFTMGNYVVPYVPSVQMVPAIGRLMGEFINGLLHTHKLSPDNVTLIGHSLGAHVVGVAGKILIKKHKKVKYIIGSDPAGPCFFNKDSAKRLDKNDAQFVQIVHTGMDTWGIDFPIGTANYIVNGGQRQPKCLDEWAKYLIKFLRNTIIARSTHAAHPFSAQSKKPFWDKIGDVVGCSHQRAYKYLAESIHKGCGFTSVLCDSWENYTSGSCANKPKSHMGSLNIDEKARGTYYLETNADYPFAKESRKSCT